MAYAMTKRGSLDNCITYEFMCDTVADMNRIENEYRALGSVAIVLNGESGSLEVYITDSSKEWHNFSAASGGSAAEGAGLKLHLCTQDEVEEGLPNISDPDENTIYLVPGSEEENNLYEEYFYIDDGWEKFGSAGVDLSGYYQKPSTGIPASDLANGVIPDTSIYAPIASPNFTGSISLGRAANTTVGAGSVAEGDYVTASGVLSHAEGGGTTASGNQSHAEGTSTIASGNQSHAEGSGTTASGYQSHAEGSGTIASGNQSHAEGAGTTASNVTSHAEGTGTKAFGANSHAEGAGTIANNANSHAEGNATVANGANSHAEGDSTTANGPLSHAEGTGDTTATTTIDNKTYTGTGAHGAASHAEGENTWAIGDMSHTEGRNTTASGNYSHAEGEYTTASSIQSHAEGYSTTASGPASHAEGNQTTASGQSSHAEGYSTDAKGSYSHVGGQYNVQDSYNNWPEWAASTSYKVGDKVKRTIGSGSNQTIQGYICKTANSNSTFISSNWTNQYGKMNYAEIIGNGTNKNARSNARALDWDGNEYLMGDIYVGCNADSTGGTKVVTEAVLASLINRITALESKVAYLEGQHVPDAAVTDETGAQVTDESSNFITYNN